MDSTENETYRPHHPHDRFFKESFGRLDVAVSFFQDFLPAPLVERIDWSTLQRVPDTFIGEVLEESSSDLLFQVNWLKREMWLHCLFEHQSTTDPLMAFRLLRYMVRIWDEHLKKCKKALPFPVIVPIVLHQGPKTWGCGDSFLELFDIPDTEKEWVQAYIPDFSFSLLDLGNIRFDELRSEVLAKSVLAVMKVIRDERPLEHLEELLMLLDSVIGKHRDPFFLRAILRYLIGASENVDLEVFKDTLANHKLKTIQQTTMTLYDQIIGEGIEKGIEEGMQRGLEKGHVAGEAAILKRQLNRRFGSLPEWVCVLLDGASQSELEQWSDAVLDAVSLEDIFGRNV